jgi:hypothetical protein
MKASAMIRVCAVLVLLGFAQAARADQTFDFSFAGPGIIGSGTLTASNVSGDEFLVTSLDGTIDGFPMSLDAPDSYLFTNDNDVFTSGPAVDGNGIAFDAFLFANDIYYSSGAYYLESCAFGYICEPPEQLYCFTLTDAPEPSMISLLGISLIGLIGLGLARRRFYSSLTAA